MESMGPALSGRDMARLELSQNQDLNLVAPGVSIAPTCLQEELGTLRKLLNELKDKVYGSGELGYVFDG